MHSVKECQHVLPAASAGVVAKAIRGREREWAAHVTFLAQCDKRVVRRVAVNFR